MEQKEQKAQKEQYEELKLEVIRFEPVDIVSISNPRNPHEGPLVGG